MPTQVRGMPAALSVPTSPGPYSGHVEMPTNRIPCSCSCSWSVIREGAGDDCLSRLTFPNRSCPCVRAHREAALAAAGAAL
jgi:hypothetical protein